VDHDQEEGTILTKTIMLSDGGKKASDDKSERKELKQRFKQGILRVMKNVSKIKRSANTRFKLLDVVSKYKNLKHTDEEEKVSRDDALGSATKSKKKGRSGEGAESEDEGVSNEEVYEDYKEFKNLILQTSKIVSEQQSKIEVLLKHLSSIPGLK